MSGQVEKVDIPGCFIDQTSLENLLKRVCTNEEDIAGLNIPTVTVTREQVCAVVGYANINRDGTIASSCGDGISSRRTATGTYEIVGPANAETVVLDVVEPVNTRDSIEIHKTIFTGGTIHISEGDNGATANTLRDRNFTAVWYGQRQIITEVQVT